MAINTRVLAAAVVRSLVCGTRGISARTGARGFCAPSNEDNEDRVGNFKAYVAHGVMRGTGWLTTKLFHQAPVCIDSPSNQMRAYAVQLRDSNNIASLRDAAILNKLEIVGMKHHKGVLDFKCKPAQLIGKTRASLLADGFPEDLVSSVIEGLEGTQEDKRMIDTFHFNDKGGTFSKGGLWIRQDDNQAHVTAMLFGSSFDLAKHVDFFKEECEDIFEVQTTYEQLKETREVSKTVPGRLFNSEHKSVESFDVVKPVTKKQKIGTRITKTPVFKQKVCTKEEFEVAQRFLASQAAHEVIMLSGQ
eukprot:TRINITY_DN105299_c0_g1_i1.p1 TRINITY_DN105299_c0_g1~~TRINITY_DN105299_c0_g1_i1.p1  ORF type:complete len:304 (-),score=52.28 TRINITY_DN105299_c0_g1_i1:431-1342(-)